ncbi:Acyl-[acyl-carrier-protein] hydrolase [Rhynchospora pubera]|uniref:Acyl-[acyl-carrier-protein] hydrolase n=1 Tax=Rhynchospora pubera TaxID=906938 RepID=A0AAV8E449_9POAL|nr:Acyl-[acyl-carrier-protein] hydrolase [Rhynchospora pubera]KAJ4805342.1 Acyl-[acyl-carrier-protein] hydrolase [Rhynchospora pubera]
MFSLSFAPTSLSTASVQYRGRYNLSGASRQVKCSADAGQSIAYSVPSLEKEKATTREPVVKREMTLGEKMRFGGYEGDEELVYKECFVMRGTQIGSKKTITIETIASLLQETSCNRAQRSGWLTDGFPTPPTMKKHGLIWITSRVHIEMYKYPTWGDVVEIEHWWEPDGRIAARFDYMIRNLSTGEVIGRATRSAFPEKNSRSSKKIPQLEEPADFSQLGLSSIPQDIVETHELEAITIEFRQECHYDDSVDSLASNEVEVEMDSNAGSEDNYQFVHLLKSAGSNHEINRGRTVWRKLER